MRTVLVIIALALAAFSALSVGTPVSIRTADASLITVGGGAGSGPLPDVAEAGSNEARIDDVLNGRTPPFSYNYPADPVTTTTCNAGSAAAFNNCADDAGTLITVTGSFSGNVAIVANDIDVVMDNAHTIDGRVSLGSNSVVASRVRWTGGNIGTLAGFQFEDVLIDDVYAVATPSTAIDSSRPVHDMAAGFVDGTNPPYSRLAFINTTMELAGDPGAPAGNWMWALFTGGNQDFDLIIANTKLVSNHQSIRLNRTERLVIVGSVFNPDGGASNGMRLHRENNNVWIKDSWSRGLFKADAVNENDTGPSFTNAVFDNYDRYDNVNGVITQGGFSNTGTWSNSTRFGGSEGAGFGNISPMTQSNNDQQVWDGSTVPDFSAIGAIR